MHNREFLSYVRFIYGYCFINTVSSSSFSSGGKVILLPLSVAVSVLSESSNFPSITCFVYLNVIMPALESV